MCCTWLSVGPQQAPYRSVGPHVPHGDKVRLANLILTSLEGVETVLGYDDFEVIQDRSGMLFFVVLGGNSIGYRWLSIIGVKKSVKGV